MWLQIGMIGGFLCLLGAVVFFSSKSGSKSAQLEALKSELKKRAEEQYRAQKIISNVNSRSSDDARKRLQNISSKQ